MHLTMFEKKDASIF